MSAQLRDESIWSWWCEDCMTGAGPYYDGKDAAQRDADAHDAKGLCDEMRDLP